MYKCLAALFFGFLLSSCATTVKLTVTNPTPVAQQVSVNIKSPQGVPVRTIALGTIQGNGKNVSTEFEVKSDGQFIVNSAIPGSIEVFSEPRTITGNEPDPLITSVELSIPGNGMFDPAMGANQLQNALSKLGKNLGFRPIPIENGLKTIFGALIVLTPPKAPGDDEIIHFKLAPGQFSPSIALDQFRFPDDRVTNSAIINGSSSVGIAATVPIFGELNLNNKADSIYKIKYVLENYGMVEKTDPADWNYVNAINSLTPLEITALHDAVSTNPGSVVLYINKIYVVKRASLDALEGIKMETGGKLSAGSIVTAGGAYTFSSEVVSNKEFNDTIVNIGGITIGLELIKSVANRINSIPVSSETRLTPAMINRGNAILSPTKIEPVMVLDIAPKTQEIISNNTSTIQ